MIGKKFLDRVVTIVAVSVLMVCWSSTSYSQVTLSVGDSSGLPGSEENSVEVNLANPNDRIKGISMNVCDVENYLTIVSDCPEPECIPPVYGCEANPDRAPNFSCNVNELDDGCVRVMFFGFGGVIEEGTGPVFTLKYDVSGGAPSGDCKGINPEDVTFVNEDGDPLQTSVTLESGEFCFLACSVDEDCDDGLYCNGAEICDPISGTCQPGDYPCQTPPNHSCNEDTDTCEEGPPPVFISVEDSSGPPGSSDNVVDIDMDNQYKIRGVSMDVCDVGNYLSIVSDCPEPECTPPVYGCEANPDRAPNFSCNVNELDNGCARVVFFGFGSMIEEGAGSIFTLKYDVSGGAPSGECRDQSPTDITLVDEGGDPLEAPVIPGSGEFCFLSCSVDEDCEDGLYCNGAEICDPISGTCQPGNYPCQTPPNYSCNEDTDTCEEGPEPVVISVGDGAGLPGSSDNMVDVSMDNTYRVKGVSLDVCDVGNYLSIVPDCPEPECIPPVRGCEANPDRAPNFSCNVNELDNGCVRAVFFGFGSIIEEGTGPIFTLNYDVSGGASGCSELNPKDITLVNEDGDPLEVPVIPESGEFCFFFCTSDEECDDGLFCNGAETCVDGFCQEGSDPCPDDGLYCTGVEGCDEDNDVCTQSGNPCPPPLVCNEVDDICNCTQDEDCWDNLFCNGVEMCVDGNCQPGTNPCPETDCNHCQEDTDDCFDPDGASCEDSEFCNGGDTCDGQGSCVHSGDPCPPPLVCNEAEGVCNCSVDGDCDDGIFCTGVETCAESICPPATYPCPGQACDETNHCKPVSIVVGNGSGFLGFQDNPLDVSMDSEYIEVKAISMDVCDVDDYLTCTGCEITERTNSFSCSPAEQPDGCCRVVLVDLAGNTIAGGTGPIFTLKYDVDPLAPGGECRSLEAQSMSVADKYNQPLNVDTVSGEFCFDSCTSQADCDDGNTCTDDLCNGTGACEYANNTDSCDDGLFCNGSDTCDGLGNCVHSGDPCPPETTCNEETDSCDPLTTTTTTIPTTTTTGLTTTTTTTTEPTTTTTTTAALGLGVDFVASQTVGVPPFKVNFTAQVAGDRNSIKDYRWDFGDAGTSREENPSHIYIAVGDYSVELVVVVKDGSSKTETKPDYIESANPCPFAVSLNNKEKLAILRGFRDNILLKNENGLIITFLFYRNSLEVTDILSRHQGLKENVRLLVSKYLSMINGITNGGETYLGESDKSDIIKLLEKVKGKGSPHLKDDIDFLIEAIEAGGLLESLLTIDGE